MAAILHGGRDRGLKPAALKDVGNRLDVWIHGPPDEGTNFNEVVNFAQILGNDSASEQVAIMNCESEPEIEVADISGDAMAASTVHKGPICYPIRAKYVIMPDADNPADQSFTFFVTYQVIT